MASAQALLSSTVAGRQLLGRRLLQSSASSTTLGSHRKASFIVRASSSPPVKQGADRQLWFASRQSLSYLDGSLPGDYGFDPLGLSDPEGPGGFIEPKWLAYGEVINGRYAMMGVVGAIAPEILGKLGLVPPETALPWFKTGVIPPAGTIFLPETLMACTLDFRCLDEGLGGQKNKRKRSQVDGPETMEVDGSAEAIVGDLGDLAPQAKRPALPSLENPEKPALMGLPTYDGVIAGKVSGRKWKQTRTQRASSAHVSYRGTTLEFRIKEKQLKRAFKERKEELKEEIRKNKEEKRKKREEREKKKKENILRSGTKLQKVTNPKTLQKIAKSKQKKLLKVVPDDLFNKRNSKSREEAP